MEIKLFTDLIDALDKVVKGLRSIADLPREERNKYRQTLDETYQLIDTTLNMVIIRLGDVALESDDVLFLDEVRGLENDQGWYEAERSFRICKSLRVAVSETRKLRTSLPGRISVADWDRLIDLMEEILATEGEVAEFIGAHLSDLSRYVDEAGVTLDQVRQRVRAFRDTLRKERQRLIQHEIALYDAI